MRQELKRLVAALFTFALGLAAVMLWIEYRRPVTQNLGEPPCFRPPYYESTAAQCSGADFSALGSIPNLSYCELVNNAELYDNKIVRVRAILVGTMHGTVLYDKRCPSTRDNRTEAAITFNQTMVKENRHSLAEANDSKNLYEFDPLDLVVVGRLKRVTPTYMSDDIWDTTSLHFEVMRVEKASKRMQENLK